VGGLIVTETLVAGPEPIEALIVPVVELATGDDCAENGALVAPAGTVTVDGTLKDILLLFKLTLMPPEGAGALMVTEPVVVHPPMTLTGLAVMVVTEKGLTAKVAVCFPVPLVAVTVTCVEADTCDVVTLKFPLLLPAPIEIDAGTLAAAFELLSETTTPVGPACPLKVTVPVTVAPDPPTTLVGESVRPVIVAGLIVNVAESDTDPSIAPMVALVTTDTPLVLTVSVAEFAPAATVTLAGVVAAVALEVMVTTIPPVGAGPLSVTVPEELFPPMTAVGDTFRPVIVGELIVRVAVAEEAPVVAVIVADVWEETADVEILKETDVAPADTVTLAGGVAPAALEVSETVKPPAGAGLPSANVPVDEAPPVTAVGETVKLLIDGGSIESAADAEVPPDLPIIFTELVEPTGEGEIVNAAVVAPPATTTSAGTNVGEPLVAKLTTSPPAGAAWVSITVPVEVEPPTTELGLTLIDAMGTELTWVPTAYKFPSFEPM